MSKRSFTHLYLHIAPGYDIPFMLHDSNPKFFGHLREDYLVIHADTCPWSKEEPPHWHDRCSDCDAIMVFRAVNGEPRREFSKMEGVTILPFDHRPIDAKTAAAFSRLGIEAKEGDISKEIAHRLYEHFGMIWMCPETFDI